MKSFKIGFAFLLLVNVISIQILSANTLQGHVVSIQEVQKKVDSQYTQRMNNIQEIQKLLRHSEVQKHLGGLYDLKKIEAAVSNLDDATLEDLASRSRFANDQLQAGMGTVGIAILVAVIVVGAILIIGLVYYHSVMND